MPLYTDPQGRFSLDIPAGWTPDGETSWLPVAGDDAVHLYDHSSMSGDRTLGTDAAYRMRPGCRVYALAASRRTEMLDGCSAECVTWIEDKGDGRIWGVAQWLIDLGDVCLDIHLFSNEGDLSAASELDPVARSFRQLRDPMEHLRDWQREAYAGRIAETKARLADPTARDFLDETIEAIANGLGRQALARKDEIAALSKKDCKVKHPRLGTVSFNPAEEDWSVPLPLAGAPNRCKVLIAIERQPSFAQECETILTKIDRFADRILATSARWDWASLTLAVGERIAPTYNDHWRGEDAPILSAADLAGRLRKPSGLAIDTQVGPSLTLYFDVTGNLFHGHRVDAVMNEDGSIAVCGLVG